MSIFTETYRDPPGGMASAGPCMGSWPYGKNLITASGYPCSADLAVYGLAVLAALVIGGLLLSGHRRAVVVATAHAKSTRRNPRPEAAHLRPGGRRHAARQASGRASR